MSSANVNSVDNFYWTPLHMAAHSGVRAVVEYLLDHGASLEAKSLTGATPIMKAIETCSLDVVQMLINRGAKVRAEDMCSKSSHFHIIHHKPYIHPTAGLCVNTVHAIQYLSTCDYFETLSASFWWISP